MTKATEFSLPYIDVRGLNDTEKAKKIKSAGFFAEDLDMSLGLETNLYKSENIIHVGKYVPRALVYNTTDPIVLNQAIFHKDIIENLKNTKFLFDDPVWIVEDKKASALFVKYSKKPFEKVNRDDHTYDEIKRSYLIMLKMIKKLEDNNAAIVDLDFSIFVELDRYEFSARTFAYVYEIGQEAYVALDSYPQVKADKIFKNIHKINYGIIKVPKDANIKYAMKLIAIDFPSFIAELKNQNDLKKANNLMKNFYKLKQKVEGPNESSLTINSLISFFKADGDLSILAQSDKVLESTLNNQSKPISSPNVDKKINARLLSPSHS